MTLTSSIHGWGIILQHLSKKSVAIPAPRYLGSITIRETVLKLRLSDLIRSRGLL